MTFISHKILINQFILILFIEETNMPLADRQSAVYFKLYFSKPQFNTEEGKIFLIVF